jgi:hypothetical protein
MHAVKIGRMGGIKKCGDADILYSLYPALLIGRSGTQLVPQCGR